MKLLIYTLNFLLILISKNKGKLITLVMMFTLFHVAYNTDAYKDVNRQLTILKDIKIDDTYYYFYKDGSELKYIKRYEPQKFKDNIYNYTTDSDTFVICVVFGYIILIIFIIVSIVGYNNDDINWELDDVLKEAFKTLISCELENGTYYYIVMGRLIEESKNQIYYYNVNGFKKLALCPKFKTKAQYRDSVLNKLLK